MAGEWESYRLDELCEFINGFAFKSTDYVPPSTDAIEVFRMGYIQRGGGFKEDDSPVFVPQKYGKRLDRYLLRPDDITIAMTDMKDRVAILGNTAWIREAKRFVLNQRVGRIRVKRPDLLDSRFLYFYSNWRPQIEYLRSRANSGVQVNLSTSAIKESELKIPPLAEQRAIAHILGTLDDKIELNRRMSETLEAMARALFKSWFVDFDPVRAKAEGRDPGLPKPLADLFPTRLVDSELGEIPEGWSVGRFNNVAESLRDQENPLDSPGVAFEHFSIPAFDEGNLPKRELGATIKSLKWRVPAEVILLSKLNPEIERVWLTDVAESERAVCSTEFLVLRPRRPFRRSYVYCLGCSPVFRQQIEALVTGTSKSHQRAQADSILNLMPAQVAQSQPLETSRCSMSGW